MGILPRALLQGACWLSKVSLPTCSHHKSVAMATALSQQPAGTLAMLVLTATVLHACPVHAPLPGTRCTHHQSGTQCSLLGLNRLLDFPLFYFHCYSTLYRNIMYTLYRYRHIHISLHNVCNIYYTSQRTHTSAKGLFITDGIAQVTLIADTLKQFYNLYCLPYFIFSEGESKETGISPSSYTDHEANIILLSSLHYFSTRNSNNLKRLNYIIL